MKLPYDNDAVPPFGGFTVSVADDAAQRQQVAAWLEAEHFLGSFRTVGHSLAQAHGIRGGTLLGESQYFRQALLFGNHIASTRGCWVFY